MTSLIDLEPAVWSEKHFSACELGDVRRTQRLVRYAQQMAEKPDASTPHQTENWADCKAVYRLFERPEVTFEAVATVHYQNTRTLPPGRYLVISDTTEIDYGYKSKRQGLGRLTAKHRRGFFLHSALVVDAQSHQVMGLGMQELWARAAGKRNRVHRVNGRKRPTESDVWGRVIDEVNGLGPDIQLIHICDRGADNFDVFAHLHLKGDSWVIRAAQMKRKLRTAGHTVLKLDEILITATLKGSYQVWVSANKKQKARWAHLEVRSVSVTMLRPREGATAFVMDHDVHEVPTNIVEVLEVDAPKGCDPLHWVLYTHESVASFDECICIVEHYEQRPLVEEYHKCLKTGLQVEGRQYETADHLEPVIGMICVQAVRLLQLRDVAREAPETPVRKLVPKEWVEVLAKVTRRPRAIKTVREFMRALAGLGGFLGRKSDGEPGWQTIWRGLETLILALRGYHAALNKCG